MSRAGSTPDVSRKAVAPDGTPPTPARPAPSGRWFVVESSGFCALVLVEGERVVRTAPVLDWILARKDRSLVWLRDYARRKRWTLEELPT